MACLCSLGDNPSDILDASLELKSGVVRIPESKWDHGLIFDPKMGVSRKAYCNAAAFASVNISCEDLGLSPHDFRTMSDSTKLTLHLAQKAILESGILQSGIPKKRIGVFVSQCSAEAFGMLRDIILNTMAEEIVNEIRKVVPREDSWIPEAVERIKSRGVAPDDTTLVGRLNSSAAGFVNVEKPVQWHCGIERLYREKGVRVFLETGAGPLPTSFL